MTKPEMNRRLATMDHRLACEVHHMILSGYGAHGITLESMATLKQANAVFEWVRRYGRIVPNASDCAGA